MRHNTLKQTCNEYQRYILLPSYVFQDLSEVRQVMPALVGWHSQLLKRPQVLEELDRERGEPVAPQIPLMARSPIESGYCDVVGLRH